MSTSVAIEGFLTTRIEPGLSPAQMERRTNPRANRADFQSLLRTTSRVAASSTADHESMLQQAAGQLVADAFLLPLLQTMHESPLRPLSGPFAAGAAEKRFMPLLDQQLADRITQSNHFPLVDSVVKHLSKITPPPRGDHHAAA